jgi:hypothetical protein
LQFQRADFLRDEIVRSINLSASASFGEVRSARGDQMRAANPDGTRFAF